MEENNNPPLTPQQFAQKVKAKYPQYKDVDDVTLAKKMVEKYPEYAKQVSFGDVKKKESSESTSQEKPSVSPTKPTQPSTSLATEEPTRAAASVALGGPTKLFGQQEQTRPQSVMYGDGVKQEDVLIPSKPLDVDESIKYLEKKTNIKRGEKFNVEELERERKELERLKYVKKNTPAKEKVEDIYTSEFNRIRNIDNYTPKAQAELDDELNQVGFLNGLKEGLSSIYNTAIEGMGRLADLSPEEISDIQIDRNPIAKEIAEVKSDPKNSKLTKKEIEFKAYQLAIDNKAKSLRRSETDNYLESIPDDVKNNLQFEKVDGLKTISDDVKKVVKVRDFYLASIENNLETLDKLKIENPNSQEVVSLKNKINSDIDYIKKLDRSIYDVKRKHGDAAEEVDLLSRNYDMLYNISGRVTQTTLNILAKTSDLISDFVLPDSPNNPDWINNLKKSKDKIVSETVTDVGQLSDVFRKDVQDVNSVNDFINWSSDVTAVQIPILAAASTGAGGISFLGASGAAEKRYDMKQEMLSGKAQYSDLQMFAVPLLFGAAEAVSEIPTYGILKKAGLVNKAINADDTLRRELVNSTFDSVLKNLKGYTKDQFKEGSGELLTNVIQNASDKYLLGKEEVGIFDNSEDILKDTFLMTSIIQSSPHIYGAITKPFMSPEYTKLLDSNSKKILELNKLLSDETVSKEVKAIAKNKIEALNAESGNIVNKVFSNIESLNDESRIKIAKIEKDQSELRAKASTVVEDKTIDTATKKELLNDLKSQFKAVEDDRINIISGKTTVSEPTAEVTEVVAEPITEAAPAVEVTAEVKPTTSGQRVSDVINRPATLESFGGTKLDTPVEGNIYQEGQRVIFEDNNNKTYDLGNIEEISDSTVEDLGIQPQTELISVTPEGKIKVGDNTWNIQTELPNNGVEYDTDGNVKAVSLKDDAGKTVMYEGQIAEDIAYQTLLNEVQTDEQRQAINEILEKDEELNRQLREAEEAATETTGELAEPGVAEAEVTATEEITPSEIETTLDEVITPASNNIKEQISRAKKAISKFLPNVEIVYHNTAESFQAAVGDNSRGFYDTGTKKIHINGSNADKTTVSHEVFHAVVLKYISSDKQATDLTNRMFKALAKSLKGNPKLLENINKFASNYSKGLQSEEKLAEVLGYLASEYETLPSASKNIIQKWLESIAKMVGIKKFTDQEVIDFMNTIATKVAYGQEITENDVKAINQGVSTYIADPTEINRYQKPTEEKVEVGDHKLSFVKKSDLIDFDSLLKDISNKKQKVWFWVADQLGRGDYTDAVVGEDHYLDAGPSFALDPVNRKKNVIWATGKNEKEVSKLIKDSDYIFIISGSPLKSKLFNKKVIDIVAKRAGDFNSFKKNILKVSKIKPLNTLLSSVDSWEQLRNSPKRKEFLLNILSQADKNTPLKKALEKYNSIVDLNELRDGFYADNNFDTNDIMLVLKPTEFGGKSDHSTYENNILGDVIGVPDIKVNAFDILPSEIKDKYKKDLGKSQQQQVVAPYGIGVKPIERRQISPENSSNYANMTEDGKGNFVFFHFGPRGIKFVDPKKYGSNKGAITSKPEIAAMGRVGGMSQFYTMPEYQESNVSGDKYMIKVPMDKVYDFNTDPDNLIGKAKEMFKAKHPDLPFTANDQLAYITKLAEKAGYDMTVAEWNGMSRAQSTKPLTPVDTQVMDGNTISKPFKENYESNASKGFTPVIPTSKEAMLKKVYEDINMERNAKNRYDNLYSLAEDFPKLSQDEITDMIVNSDISQELKDAYNTAVAYEPGTRMSGRRQIDPKTIAQNTKAEVDRVKALPIQAEDGATFNLDGTKYDGGGLVVPLNSIKGNTTQEKLTPEMIGDFAKENEDSVSDESMVKMGIYKFPDKVDVSVDMNIVIPREHREVALEFGALIGQESLYDLDSNENIKTGGDGLNPMDLTAEQFREAATSLKNGVMPAFVSGRRQKSPIDLAVEAGKRRGFSNKEIADYLVSKGYTRSQATSAILRYDSVTAVNLRKKDSVFTKEGRNKIITFLDQVKRRAMSAKSFLPKSVFILKEGIEANIKAEAKRASYLVDDFNKLVKKYNGDLDVLNDEFDKYLRGDQNAILPDEFKAVAGKMRTHIDNLSQMLVENGVVTLSQAETIAANLGQYINRSYQVFDKKDWAKQVTEEMKEAARVELRNIFKANTGKVPATGISGFDQAFTAKVEQEAAKEGFDVDIVLEKYINEQIDSIIDRESAATFLGMGKTGSKNLSIMKEKTDIPLAIRQLMGEYTDASQNYARTILKIATLAENARFLQGARDAGMGVFFFREGDLNKPAEFSVKIAGEGSETMSPLNGLYTTKEIADAFKTSISAEKFIEGFVGTNAASTAISLYSGYMKLLSVVKWNKTIASIATHSKNITGNIWFMLSNGYFNYKKYGEAFNVLKNTKDNELRDKLDEYIRAGIIDQSAALGEIKSMFSDADFETAIENRLKKNPIEKAKKASKWVITKLNTAYQLEDDFYKIVAYESEKARYSNAEFSKPFDQLNDDQKLMVSAIAAENTKNVLPNYARIPGLVKILRVAPLTGTFISFQAEAYRTAWNTVALAFDELNSNNKKIKAIGAKRLAGIAFSQSLKFGLMSAIGTVLRGGDDDDEEDKLNKNVREFVPEWSKKSDLTLLDYGKGKFSYVDFSASDPHGGIKKAYNSFIAGEGAIESFTNGMAEILGPFVKKDMLLEAITDVNNNENSYGGKLYNESDTNVNKINAVMTRIYKVLEPGSLTSARKVAEAENVGNELAGQLTGYKVITIDVEQQLGFKMSDSKKKITEGPRRLYNSAFYKFEDKKITAEELEAVYNQANSEQKEIYKTIMNNIKAASFFGVDDYIISDAMDGLGKDVISDLWYGEAPDLKEKQVKLTDAEFKKKYGDKAFNLMLRGRELIKKGAK